MENTAPLAPSPSPGATSPASGAAGQASAAALSAPARLSDAIALLRQDRAREALVAASDACHADPALPEAHYAYGEAWLAVGEPARAEQAFAAAIRLRPSWADAWVNYGLARYRRGMIADARLAMIQALAADPHHAAATANLGAFLRISGGADAAERLLREALRRDPDNAGARLNLVADLLQEERPGEALALLEEGEPPADPAAARHWHLQRALALVDLRRPGAARAALDTFASLGPVPPELAPLWHWRLVLIALAEGDPGAARARATAMEQSLDAMGPAAVLEHRIMARYDLAKFWSGQDDHAAAFAQWRAGHAILKTLQPFSRAAHKAFVDAAIATFPPARFASGPRAGNHDPAPVFIVGMPRSGTTLCEQILGAHGQVFGAGERVALGHLFHDLGGGETAAGVAAIAGLSSAALEAAADAYLRDLHALAPGKSRIVDKMPGNYAYCWLIALLFPGARIIHCLRDPRDTGLSIFTFRFHGDHGYAHDLGDLGWTIGQHDRLMAHARTALPNPVFTLKLADWVEDFDGTLARLLAFVDLPPDPACARFHEGESRVRTVSRSQVRQPVNARGLGRWKRYEAELAPLIDELQSAGCLAAWRTAHGE